ncbi:MAG TPA: membrane dipeptidase [Candidatus Coprovicinus avistercoris]|uniref:Membrane dipeptidase n=1 Tax=Candidatus Coprovicinus avistercoris TaxID=2840754 RepID=A0A9D1L4M9_9ACTN|nr:membrane dipeptidase [Candidatus Coprovicinus avistercoris]
MPVSVFDLHSDTLDRLAWPLLPSNLNSGSVTYEIDPQTPVEPGVLRDFATSPGHLSLEAMSDFSWCQCLAVFIPDTLTPEQSADFFKIVSDTLEEHVKRSPDLLAVAREANQIESILSSGRTCGILTIENGKLLAAREDMFDVIAQAGVRMVTLTWNAANPLGSGHDTHQGLTSFGRRAIAELESRHIIVDVSHLNDEGFADVAACARRPFVASHSNSRAIRDVPRNLTDDQFKFIRDAGGIVGLNFCDWFISATKDPTPEELFAHIDHWLDLGGSKTISLGSDYDGCDTPSWLDPCTHMQNLFQMAEERYGSYLAKRLFFDNAYEFFIRNEMDDEDARKQAQELDELI